MILVLGLAGSGKSTQCEMLQATGKYQWLSIGQMLRTAVSDPEQKKIIDSGDILDDHIVVPMVASNIKRLGDSPELILDGFPRTLDQVKWLHGLQLSDQIIISAALHLKVNEETAYSRLLKRGRTDDHDTAINERFIEYKTVILPILQFLKSNGVKEHEIDGEESREVVHQKILAALGAK